MHCENVKRRTCECRPEHQCLPISRTGDLKIARTLADKVFRLKSHFSTLLSTLSFTLYALLPTLSPQLDSAYPVELTSQALQGLSNPTSSQISTVSADNESEGVLESSVPDIPVEVENRGRSLSSGSRAEGGSVSESWASEFRGDGQLGMGPESVMTETDDGVSNDSYFQPIVNDATISADQ